MTYSSQDVESKMSCTKTVVVLLLAATEVLWIREVSADLMEDLFRIRGALIHTDDSLKDEQNRYGSRTIQIGNTYPENDGGDTTYGSRTIQIGNTYPENDGKRTVTGARDIQVGNVYPANSNGFTRYGPLLIQRNNVFRGTGENQLFGAKVVQVGNVYPKNVGKNDTFAPVIIQSDNVYPDNVGQNTVVGVIVNQTNNTYPKALEGNDDALNPVIIQRGNVYPKTPETDSVVRAIINRNGNVFHSTQHEDNHGAIDLDGHESTNVNGKILSLGKMKKQHEEINRIIKFHIRSDKSTSKRCSNGMIDSERLNQIGNLQLEVQKEVNLIKALVRINRSRKIICDFIPARCHKHDEVRKWISVMRMELWKKSEKSRKLWAGLRTC